MEILVKIISFTILASLIVSPFFVIYCFNKIKWRKNYIGYIASGILITFILTTIFGWWADFSNDILLKHYGYNFEAMNAMERFENVEAKNIDKVNVLERSMLGIGWPLKVIMSYVFFSPVLLILYSLVYYFKVIRKKESVS
jgi:hypothetical protein